MARITSDCGTMHSLSIKWPESPRIVCCASGELRLARAAHVRPVPDAVGARHAAGRLVRTRHAHAHTHTEKSHTNQNGTQRHRHGTSVLGMPLLPAPPRPPRCPAGWALPRPARAQLNGRDVGGPGRAGRVSLIVSAPPLPAQAGKCRPARGAPDHGRRVHRDSSGLRPLVPDRLADILVLSREFAAPRSPYYNTHTSIRI